LIASAMPRRSIAGLHRRSGYRRFASCQAGRIPIRREAFSRDGDACAAHAHRAGTHDDEFRRERVPPSARNTIVMAAREIEFIRITRRPPDERLAESIG
jgi:hypothetical protein